MFLLTYLLMRYMIRQYRVAQKTKWHVRYRLFPLFLRHRVYYWIYYGPKDATVDYFAVSSKQIGWWSMLLLELDM